MQRKKKKAVQTSKPGVKKKLSWLHSIAEIQPRVWSLWPETFLPPEAREIL